MSINENWNIRSRSHTCTHSGHPFTDGETFYTALFEDPQTDDLVRRDYSLVSWDALKGELHPFSFWKSVYEAPHSEAKVEVVEKENAEGLLRRLVEEDAPGTENTRYILAIMLERKKILKHTATRETEDANFLIYEHPKTGEVYLIRDPELKLDQVDSVQRVVTLLLTHGAHGRTSDGTAVEPGTSAPATESPESTPVAAADGTEAEAVPETQMESGGDEEAEALKSTIDAVDAAPGQTEEEEVPLDLVEDDEEDEPEPEAETELLTNIEDDSEDSSGGKAVPETDSAVRADTE